MGYRLAWLFSHITWVCSKSGYKIKNGRRSKIVRGPHTAARGYLWPKHFKDFCDDWNICEYSEVNEG